MLLFPEKHSIYRSAMTMVAAGMRRGRAGEQEREGNVIKSP